MYGLTLYTFYTFVTTAVAVTHGSQARHLHLSSDRRVSGKQTLSSDADVAIAVGELSKMGVLLKHIHYGASASNQVENNYLPLGLSQTIPQRNFNPSKTTLYSSKDMDGEEYERTPKHVDYGYNLPARRPAAAHASPQNVESTYDQTNYGQTSAEAAPQHDEHSCDQATPSPLLSQAASQPAPQRAPQTPHVEPSYGQQMYGQMQQQSFPHHLKSSYDRRILEETSPEAAPQHVRSSYDQQTYIQMPQRAPPQHVVKPSYARTAYAQVPQQASPQHVKSSYDQKNREQMSSQAVPQHVGSFLSRYDQATPQIVATQVPSQRIGGVYDPTTTAYLKVGRMNPKVPTEAYEFGAAPSRTATRLPNITTP